MQNLHNIISTAAAHTKADIEQVEAKVKNLGTTLEAEAKEAPIELVASIRTELQILMTDLASAKNRLVRAETLSRPNTNSTPSKS